MADSPPRHETADNQGSTIQQSGSVNTTGVLIPAVAGAPISEFLVNAPEGTDIDDRILVSVNDVDFMTLHPSGHLGWTPKGDSVTQIRVKSNNNAGVPYELIMNLEVD